MNSQHTYWIFGRGVSMNCGLRWDTSHIENYNGLSREDKINLVSMELLRAQAEGGVGLEPYLKMFELLDARNCGTSNHTLATLNWDTLADNALEHRYPSVNPPWLESGGIVYHWNGSCRDRAEKSPQGLRVQSPFILPEDTHQFRNQIINRSIEGNYAFNKMPLLGGCYVVAGVSLTNQCDETLFLLMKHMDQGDRGNLFMEIHP